MNISWLSLRDLEYLAAVAQYGHFGKAAESCHVSQPALSAQIKKIEDFLGVMVFERTNRRVAITEVGQSIVAQTQLVLEEAQKIVALAQTKAEPLKGNLRFGAIATLGPYFIPQILGPLRKAYPQLEVLFKEGLTDGLIAQLRTGSLDMMIAARTFDETGLKVAPLFFEPFVVAFPKEHLLAKKKNLRPADLRASEMILLEDGHCLRDQAIETCPTPKRGSYQAFQGTSLETMRHLVAGGLGYTFFPQLAVNEFRALNDLIVYKEFENRNIGRSIVLVCRERFSDVKSFDALAEFIRKNLPKGVRRDERS